MCVNVHTHTHTHVLCVISDNCRLLWIYMKPCELSSSHGGGYEAQNLLGYTAMFLIGCRPTFQRCVQPPSSGWLMTEAARTSETSVDIQLRTKAVHPRRFWALYEAIWRVVTVRGIWRYGAIKLTDVACRLLYCWADIYRRTWADVDIQTTRVAWMGVFKQLSLQHAPYAARFMTSVRDQVICSADDNVTAHKTQRNIQDFSQDFLCVFSVSPQ
jgi:hypothetical protein